MIGNDAQDCFEHFKAWIEKSVNLISAPKGLNSQYELALYYNVIGVAYGMSGLYDSAIDHLLKSIDFVQKMNDYDDTLLSWPDPTWNSFIGCKVVTRKRKLPCWRYCRCRKKPGVWTMRRRFSTYN